MTGSTFTWATVTALGPLRVKLDGDTSELPFTPDSLVDPLTLAVNNRVRCELSANRVIVLGVAGGHAQGLMRIVPTSVAGGGVTLGANGKVSFSASTTASVNGCFTSVYDDYLIVFDFVATAANATALVLRNAGVDATTAEYDFQRLTATGTTVSAATQLAQTAVALDSGIGIANASRTGHLTLRGPAIAAATRGRVEALVTANPMTSSAGILTAGIQHRALIAYDGFTLTPGGAGTFTGSLRIYGYN